MQDAEEAAIAKENKLAAQQEARENAAAAALAAENMVKSPSAYSCHSYESFVNQEKTNDDNNKERMSIRSVESFTTEQRGIKIAGGANHVGSTTTKPRKPTSSSAVSFIPISVHLHLSVFSLCILCVAIMVEFFFILLTTFQ